jgi:hypothetical protein
MSYICIIIRDNVIQLHYYRRQCHTFALLSEIMSYSYTIIGDNVIHLHYYRSLCHIRTLLSKTMSYIYTFIGDNVITALLLDAMLNLHTYCQMKCNTSIHNARKNFIGIHLLSEKMLFMRTM